MAKTTERKITGGLIFSLLVFFPFGRLASFEFSLWGFRVSVLAMDLVALATLVFDFYLVKKNTRRLVSASFKKELTALFLLLGFSFLFSWAFLADFRVFYGVLYSLRLFLYGGVFLLTSEFINGKKGKKEFLFNCLLAVLFSAAVFGWFQYLFYPDLRALKFLGWDDHLFRLTGTFLDPGYTAILFVFGFILAWSKYDNDRKKTWFGLALFFVVSLALTFSRAGYLALLAGVLTLGFLKPQSSKSLFWLSLSFILTLFLIPKPAGEGVNLARTYSLESRLENYVETGQIFIRSPLFGVGFNNLCLAKKSFGIKVEPLSHACGGADSSFLMILATLGIIGLMMAGYWFILVWQRIESDKFGLALKAIFISLLIHSQFNNSLFYPWVLIFLALFLPLALKTNAKNQP